jgi:N-acetyl-anhydromuramyl-L-alanine amidase AmpD
MFGYIKDLGLEPKRPYTERNKTDLIVLHHFESDASAQAVHAYHISRGHKGIDYNIVILKNGDVVWGRGLEYEGGHTNNSEPRTRGVNARSVGIACQGNFNLEKMGAAQKDALKRIAREVADFYDIKEIVSHKEISGTDYTDCPGTYFPTDEVREYALRKVDDWTPPTFHITKILRLGMDDAEVMHITRNLTALKFIDRDCTSVFDDEVEEAVRAFQRKYNLKEDGEVGPITTAAMGGVWDEKK